MLATPTHTLAPKPTVVRDFLFQLGAQQAAGGNTGPITAARRYLLDFSPCITLITRGLAQGTWYRPGQNGT